MKKKYISFTLSMVIAFSFTINNSNAYAESSETSSKPIMQIPVISDIHVGGQAEKETLTQVLDYYNKIIPDYPAFAVVGDFTNEGNEKEYDDFMNIFNNKVNSAAEKILTMGNHEYFEGVYHPNAELTDEVLKKRFLSKTGMSEIYYDKWVQGYHFITLGGEESVVTNPANKDSAVISNNQYQWLEKTLSIKADPKKPIFVFLHQPLDDTTYGSLSWGAGLRHDQRLKTILKDYPQVILLSGHTHYSLEHPRSTYQDSFTMTETGALLNNYDDRGMLKDKRPQGLILNVYDDKVDILALDFNKSKVINTTTIKVPFVKTIGETIRPSFPQTAEVEVNKITNNSVSLTWDTATDDTLVDRYEIYIERKLVHTEYVEIWDNPTPEKPKATITNLPANTVQNIIITAQDAWGNKSTNTLKVAVTTKRHMGFDYLNKIKSFVLSLFA